MRQPRSLMTAAALVVATVGCAAGSPTVQTSAPEPSKTAPSTTTPTITTSVTPARRARSVVAAQPPRTAVLPTGRRVPINAVGTTSAGLLDVPDDIDVAGWWRGGSRLGDPFGSILVAAHVDSRTQGLGPFAELLTVEPGARMLVESAGLSQSFEVRSRRLVPQGDLVDDSWIFDVSGGSRLTLVTCAPPYDAARGGYQNLAVVTAVPVSLPDRT